ncbi:Hypothetical_protein [Hexamita inflata]|uniref:Hypothetical_protein n=1 Tax=Hexamita inflata TaxID=28002 RepID=A0AA86R230_9EUKA|nr:Hypothetical protein HINF_LOCUS55483 [Hexamita inflata]
MQNMNFSYWFWSEIKKFQQRINIQRQEIYTIQFKYSLIAKYCYVLTQQKKRLANDALLGFISGQFDIFKSVDNACLEIEQNMQILAEFIEIQAKFYNPQALHTGRIYMLEQVFQKLLRLTDSEKEFELNLQKFMEIRANTKLYYIPESKNKRIQQEVEYVKMVFDECDDNIRFLVDCNIVTSIIIKSFTSVSKNVFWNDYVIYILPQGQMLLQNQKVLVQIGNYNQYARTEQTKYMMSNIFESLNVKAQLQPKIMIKYQSISIVNSRVVIWHADTLKIVFALTQQCSGFKKMKVETWQRQQIAFQVFYFTMTSSPKIKNYFNNKSTSFQHFSSNSNSNFNVFNSLNIYLKQTIEIKTFTEGRQDMMMWPKFKN